MLRRPKKVGCVSSSPKGSSEWAATGWYDWLEGAWAAILPSRGVCSSQTVSSVSGACTAGGGTEEDRHTTYVHIAELISCKVHCVFVVYQSGVYLVLWSPIPVKYASCMHLYLNTYNILLHYTVLSACMCADNTGVVNQGW